MGSFFLTKGKDSFCIIKDKNFYFLYKLERTKEYSFNFYTKKRFEISLNQDIPLSEQPYGILGSSLDFSGRRLGYLTKMEPLISHSGNKIISLEYPIYSLIGKYEKSDLMRNLDDFSLEQKDFPYALISTQTIGISDYGDDLYLKTLFFMTKGYGLLTKLSAIAGRDSDDCCSPEFHSYIYKVKLDNINPLKNTKRDDMVSGAVPSESTVSVSPEINTPFKVNNENDPQKFKNLDTLIDELFITLSPNKLLD